MTDGMTHDMATDAGQSTPAVTVVIPCYNSKAFVCHAIDSALDQTHPNTEVVVIDDGSTDQVCDLLEAKYGNRIVVIRQENRGLQEARNVGIATARGEYVVLLDADDVLSQSAVASHLSFMRDSRVGIVTGYYRRIGLHGEILERVPQVRRLRPSSHFYQAVRRNYGPPVGWMIRREAITRCGGFDPALPSCDDWDLLVRIAAQYRIAYDPSVTGYYRQVPGSMSRNHLTMYDTANRMLA